MSVVHWRRVTTSASDLAPDEGLQKDCSRTLKACAACCVCACTEQNALCCQARWLLDVVDHMASPIKSFESKTSVIFMCAIGILAFVRSRLNGDANSAIRLLF